ncbi:MAG: organic solvent tolerance protein OstA [Bacteroidetes bacterium]|nr:organic solvent tolerance protein OstA [Bacteroidota bacterium]
MHRYFILLFLLPCFAAFSQEPGKTKIQYSGNVWEFNKDIYEFGPRILGNVVMNHDSAFLYCDSAYVNEAENKVIAYGNVRIKLSDTLNLYSDSLRYDGNTKIAHANSNVRLIDNQTTLTTDTLIYNRNSKIAQYDYWGKIVNDKNNLVSHHGYYYTDNKQFFFKDKVILINPDYNMFSDTLMYNTVTEISYFYGPSHIISKDKKDSIYCENGWYNTRLDVARFRDRARIYHEATYLTGDSMYYERKNGFGQVFRKALIYDTVQNIMLMGNYGEMQRKKGFAFMTDSAVSVLVDKKDSLFMHGDTVRATFDSVQKIKTVFCFYQVKFFRHDIQGMCDSLAYLSKDSSMTMYHDPVLWSDSNQLSADSIRLTILNGVADSLKLYSSAFIISRDDTANFNQIKGRNVLAKFRNNELYKINVLGNAQTIYFAREEDKTLIGINVAVSSDMLVFLEKNQLKSITYIDKPEAHLYPEKEVPPNERKLKGFKWEEKRRPLKKMDIFVW